MRSCLGLILSIVAGPVLLMKAIESLFTAAEVITTVQDIQEGVQEVNEHKEGLLIGFLIAMFVLCGFGMVLFMSR